MVKCHISKAKGYVRVKSSGTADDITKEAIVMLKELYWGIRKENPGAAIKFLNLVFAALVDTKSPIYQKEDEK